MVGEKLRGLNMEDIRKIVELFLHGYVQEDAKEVWFDKIKSVARQCGYADNSKDFREHPENFIGSISDVTRIMRIMLSGREQGPDLHSIMGVLGKEEVTGRLGKFL
jgi:glutamyl-tRNA synthetase